MASQKQQYTILYGRLSQEDERAGESNSIQHQRDLLEKYARDKGFENTLFLADDGYSGTNFERPSWKKIVEMIETGEVSTLIVKDASRLGREYLQVGYYMEIYFPQKNVRFIAVNDGVDSAVESSNDFNPIRNWTNELHAKDTSRKVRAVKKLQAERGEWLGGRPPYGYRKSETAENYLEPDPEAAEIVRQIFSLCAAGKGPSQIARILTERNILTPANYYFQKAGKTHKGCDALHPCTWSGTTVSDILKNVMYLGHTVGLRRTTISYKNKTRIDRPESEQCLVKNTHQPLISQEQWEIVQEVRQHKKRTAKHMDEPNIFSGLVFCADCGKPLVLHRASTMKKKMPKWALANLMDLYLYPRLFEPLFRGFFGKAACFCSRQSVEFWLAFLLVLPNTHSKHRCQRVSRLCDVSDVKTAGKPPSHSRTKSRRIGDAGTRESKTPAASAASGRLSVGSQQSIGF